MKKILIVKCGQTFAEIKRQYGDFDDMIITACCGIGREQFIVVDAFQGVHSYPNNEDIGAIIITGSHSMVTDYEEWSVELSRWLREISSYKIPILGICYGHQLLADAFGGKVSNHPYGIEIGTTKINVTAEGIEDPIFRNVPLSFFGHVTHYQTVTRLPERAVVLAKNEFEQHHAFVLDEHIWGVQFHPEFTAPIMHAYIDKQEKQLTVDGLKVEKLHQTVQDSNTGISIFHAFLSMADCLKVEQGC